MAGQTRKNPIPPRRRLAGWCVALVPVIASAGCVNSVRPPREVAEPAMVYIAHHGKHSSLLLPDGEALPSADGYVQYAWGDWIAFAENDNSIPSYLRAAFFSGRSALGRKVHETTDPAVLKRRIGAVRLEPVVVEQSRMAELRADLEGHWHAAPAEDRVDNDLVRLVLVPYAGPDRRYALWNHCNHTTARWLRRLGCDVWRTAMSSDFRVRGNDQS